LTLKRKEQWQKYDVIRKTPYHQPRIVLVLVVVMSHTLQALKSIIRVRASEYRIWQTEPLARQRKQLHSQLVRMAMAIHQYLEKAIIRKKHKRFLLLPDGKAVQSLRD
jgi:hypothetical protein